MRPRLPPRLGGQGACTAEHAESGRTVGTCHVTEAGAAAGTRSERRGLCVVLLIPVTAEARAGGHPISGKRMQGSSSQTRWNF